MHSQRTGSLYKNKECRAMSITDIIPDIHGQAEKLRLALKNLGWRRSGTTWKHPEPDRQIVFLGDFITSHKVADLPPQNRAIQKESLFS
jgi:hypothetical protein